MSGNGHGAKVRERGDNAGARTFAQTKPTAPGRRASDSDRVPGAYRLLYAAMGLGGIAAQFLITGNMLMRAAMVLGTFALLYMAVAGRVPGWWEK